MGSNMKKIYVFCGVGLLACILAIFLYKQIANKDKYDRNKYVAIVNDQGITRDEFEKEVQYSQSFFQWSKQKLPEKSVFEKNALEKLINITLVNQYSAKSGVAVTQAELQKRYADAIQTSTSEAQLLTTIKAMYGMDKDAYLSKLSHEILKEKIQTAVKKPLAVWLEEEKKKSTIVFLHQ